MISLGLVFFGFGTKDSPLLRTSISAVVSILLLRLTIVSVVLGAGETREKRSDRLDILHVPSELMYIPAMTPLAYNRKSIGF